MSQRNFGVLQIVSLIAVLTAGCTSLGKCGRDLNEGVVEVLGEFEVNEVEISGLGLRRSAGIDEVLVIGDRGFDVTIGAGVVGPNWVGSLRKMGLLGVEGFSVGLSEEEKKSSQFEAVAGDGTGLIAVLSEESSKISFLRGDGKFVGSIVLKVPPEHELFSDWEKDSGSRGEGMILLQNGHILLLKEKKPSMLIEFGIAGAKAGGYRPGDAVSGERGFDVPADGVVFVPLKSWKPNAAAKSEAHDLSDLAVTAKGRILALSDQDRAIFEVEKRLRDDEAKYNFECVWNLPGAVGKPEGLVVLRDGSVLVASDQKKGGNNLWRLRLGECSKER